MNVMVVIYKDVWGGGGYTNVYTVVWGLQIIHLCIMVH